MKVNWPYLLIAMLFLTGQACNRGKKKWAVNDSSRYDLLQPVIIKLPVALDEISGIAYYPKDTAVFAIVDEAGILYKIDLNRPSEIKKWKFDKKRDFEDIVLHDSIFYILISNGDIETIQFGENDSITTEQYTFPGEGKMVNEFESLYYDDSLKQLVLLCKSCDEDDAGKVSAYGFSIATQQYTSLPFPLDVSAAAQKTGKEKLKLKPSAAAINPVTGECYILSAQNKLIVVTDRKGNFRSLFELAPRIYKQPEGIAFTPTGDLIISNESGGSGAGNILLIRNKKKGL